MTMKQTKEQFVGITYEELLNENAWLWEELTVSSQCETCEAMLDCDECLRANDSVKERKGLDFENARLRELVADMWEYINAPINQRNSLKERLAIYDDLADRICELGVEAGG